MTDYLLIAIIVLLALSLLVNVAVWSRGNSIGNHLAWWVRDTCKDIRRGQLRYRYRRGRNGRKRL